MSLNLLDKQAGWSVKCLWKLDSGMLWNCHSKIWVDGILPIAELALKIWLKDRYFNGLRTGDRYFDKLSTSDGSSADSRVKVFVCYPQNHRSGPKFLKVEGWGAKSRSNSRYVHIYGYRYKIKIGLDTIYLFPIMIENFRWEGCGKFWLHIARSSMLGLCDVVANASITSGFIKVAYSSSYVDL